jgi:microcin C transport system ATP-binding protein
LVLQPRILVLDEPTSALDATMARQVLELLQQLQREQGLSYVLITHDVAVVRAMAHAVAVMRDGQILEYGSLEQVFGAPAHEYTRKLLDSAQ